MTQRLHAAKNPADAAFLKGFFKTAKGQYGEGDRFLGIRVPVLRAMARDFRELTLEDTARLLALPWHEARLVALILLTNSHRRGNTAARSAIYKAYLTHTQHINNWDLVDTSAPGIVGAHLATRKRRKLAALARSKNLWERRIAIVATLHFIRAGEFDDTLRIAERLLADQHDLIHKAVGWMLREVGKRDSSQLEAFLDEHVTRMPRTTLRYAIERMPRTQREAYMRR
ncbi:MAG TPA: DNA alkylation repair protein [Gemmatimonadaceae bacterium]